MASTSTPEFKVILCGEYGVGKTSLFRRFTNNTFVDTSSMSAAQSRASTLGLDHYSKKFENNDRPIKLQLWDTGGLEQVASMTNSYYKFTEAALLVFSLNSLESFHSLSQHLLDILSLAENAKIFLVGNKLDMAQHEVTDADIEQFEEQFPYFNGVYKISCKNNVGIEEMFDDICEKLTGSYSLKATINAIKLHTHGVDGCCSNSSNEDSKEDGNSCCAK